MGTPRLVTSVVARAMTLYDHNRNGQIDLSKATDPTDAIRTDNEAYRVEWRALRGVKDEVIVGAYTMRDLFYAADRNHDNCVTRHELESEIARYDTDKDGFLSTRSVGEWLLAKPRAEWERFKRFLGERPVRVEEIDIRRDSAGKQAFPVPQPAISSANTYGTLKQKAPTASQGQPETGAVGAVGLREQLQMLQNAR